MVSSLSELMPKSENSKTTLFNINHFYINNSGYYPSSPNNDVFKEDAAPSEGPMGHESRTRFSLAHFLRIRMMYTAWGLPEFCSIRITSLSVSLEDAG